MKIRSLVIILIFFIQIKKSLAQQDIYYSFYTLNKLFYNPAFINDEEKNLAITLINKNQALKIDQAYNSQGFSLNTTFSQRRIGLGLIVLTEKNQNLKTSQILIPLSYKLNLDNGFLNLGLETGINISNNDFSDLEIKDPEDHVITEKTAYSPNFSIGSFYRKKNYYLGLSIKHLTTKRQKNRSTLYGIWAHEISINSLLSFIPSILIRCNNREAIFDVGTHIKIKEKILIGGHLKSYRQFNLQSSIVLNKIFNRINNNFILGYSFDYGYSQLVQSIGSSHEIILKYNLQKRPNPNAILKQRKTISPLFF